MLDPVSGRTTTGPPRRNAKPGRVKGRESADSARSSALTPGDSPRLMGQRSSGLTKMQTARPVQGRFPLRAFARRCKLVYYLSENSRAMSLRTIALAVLMGLTLGAAVVEAPRGRRKSSADQPSGLNLESRVGGECPGLSRKHGSGRILLLLNCPGGKRSEEVIK